MPEIVRSMLATGIEKPVLSTASMTWVAVVTPGSKRTSACSLARLTRASSTPGASSRARSTRPTQDAQCMPSTGRVRVWPSAFCGVFVLSGEAVAVAVVIGRIRHMRWMVECIQDKASSD